MATSSAVATGNLATAAHYNDLRTDVRATHTHDGTEGSSTLGAGGNITFDGRVLLDKGADIASASSITVGTDGNYFHITGTTGVTALSTLQAGTVIWLEFDGILTITHNGTTLILPGAENITTVAGDVFAFVSEGSGNWRAIGSSRRGDVVNDKSPQLGGDLDANGSDITGVGHVGFLASQDASAGANDLDDYEEGTWTPALTFGGGSTGMTYSAQSASYTKIGDVVHYSGGISLTAKGSSTGSALITSLPFTSRNNNNARAAAAISADSLTYTGIVMTSINPNGTDISLIDMTEAGLAAALDHTNFGNSTLVRFSGHYVV